MTWPVIAVACFLCGLTYMCWAKCVFCWWPCPFVVQVSLPKVYSVLDWICRTQGTRTLWDPAVCWSQLWPRLEGSCQDVGLEELTIQCAVQRCLACWRMGWSHSNLLNTSLVPESVWYPWNCQSVISCLPKASTPATFVTPHLFPKETFPIFCLADNFYIFTVSCPHS